MGCFCVSIETERSCRPARRAVDQQIQWRFCVQERNLVVKESFHKKGGIFTMGGRWEGKDCAVSSNDINGKVGPAPLSLPFHRTLTCIRAATCACQRLSLVYCSWRSLVTATLE